MHELAMCENLVSAVLDELKLAGRGRLIEARVVAGAMHQLVPESMHAAYDVLTRGTAAEGSSLDLWVRPVTVACNRCQWCGEIELPFFRCRQCETTSVEVLSGNELFLDRLRMEAAETVEEPT